MNAARTLALALVACAACAVAPPVVAAGPTRSVLAVPLLGDGRAPSYMLAQRSITRRWGPSEDSVYTVVDVPAWRDEGLALGLSAAVPGAGQAYAGDRWAGVAFAAAEAAGWIAHLFWRERGETLRDDARAFAGMPADAGSAWSFERWSSATQEDAADLQALYVVDPKAFYERIGSDPQLLEGWKGDAGATRAAYNRMRENADARFRNARYAAAGLWMNHVVAAVHALRVARLHNYPLRPDLDIRLDTGWREGPTVFARLERRF